VELDPLDAMGTASRSTAQLGADRFTLAGILPGEYRLQARLAGAGAADSSSASRLISVGATDVLNADLLLRPSAMLSGQVVVAADSGPIDVSAMRVRLRSMDSTIPPAAEPNDSRVAKDGTFAAAIEAGGAYRVEAQLAGPASNPSAWVKSITADGRDVTDTAINLGEGQTLPGVLITVTDHLGTVRGVLTDADGRPGTAFTVIAFPRDRGLWDTTGRRIRAARPANTGEFVMRGLPAGEYDLAAVVDPEPNAWFTPSFLDAVAQHAVLAVVSDGATTVKDLRIPKSPAR
jgi:hypothetical protein